MSNPLFSPIQRLFDFFAAVFSFIVSIFIAAFILFFAGWVIRVCAGGETTSQYIHRYVDFYQHPDQTPIGKWALETLKRARS